MRGTKKCRTKWRCKSKGSCRQLVSLLLCLSLIHNKAQTQLAPMAGMPYSLLTGYFCSIFPHRANRMRHFLDFVSVVNSLRIVLPIP